MTALEHEISATAAELARLSAMVNWQATSTTLAPFLVELYDAHQLARRITTTRHHLWDLLDTRTRQQPA